MGRGLGAIASSLCPLSAFWLPVAAPPIQTAPSPLLLKLSEQHQQLSLPSSPSPISLLSPACVFPSWNTAVSAAEWARLTVLVQLICLCLCQVGADCLRVTLPQQLLSGLVLWAAFWALLKSFLHIPIFFLRVNCSHSSLSSSEYVFDWVILLCIRHFFQMKFLYMVFLGKFCLFFSEGFLTHCCALVPFSLQTGTLWLAERFGLGFSALCGFPKMKKKPNKQNEQTVKKPQKIGKQKILCITWRWQSLQVDLPLSCYQAFE